MKKPRKVKKTAKGRKLSRKDLQKIVGDDLVKLARNLTIRNMAYVFPPDPMPKPPKVEVLARLRKIIGK
ncbi:MAG: hypothetical protein ACKVP3_07520 [Hyphomicrobiaceae bacterium]